MSLSRKRLAQEAIAAALKVRKRNEYDLSSPLCVFDLCETLGLSVFLQDIPSMEGIYLPDAQPRPVIVVSSQRPAGRRSITCGHELGHHTLGHGTQWDELIESRSDTRRFQPEEYQADLFSSALQMPKHAVSYAVAQRSLQLNHCSCEEVFALSTQFGVSYEAFVTHAERTLNLINMKRASELLKHQPKDIRAMILGELSPQNVIVVDNFWAGRAIDVEVGDAIVLPPTTQVDGKCAGVVSSSRARTRVDATQPGIGRLHNPSGWTAYLRVMRKNFVGSSRYRFEAEVSDDE